MVCRKLFEQWLGDTLAKIATEKAGIIKPGIPVLTATDEPEALVAIEKVALENNAPLTIVAADGNLPLTKFAVPFRDAATLPLPGNHQKRNATLALATIEILQKKLPVTDGEICSGLASVSWPGRLQVIQRPGGQKILLDGAHNVAGARALREALMSWSSSFSLSGGTLKCELQHAGPEAGVPITLILGVLRDKDWQHICGTLAPRAARIFTVPVASERTADAGGLAVACRAANPSSEILACISLNEALKKSAGDTLVVITGSLYLVGEALELLGLSPAAESERGLNEWSVAAQPASTGR